MTTDPFRRQVLRAVGGLVLAPVPACLPMHANGTCGHDLHRVQTDLLAALEEGALLQIDWTDMRDVLSAIGDAPPVCAVLHGPDVGAVVNQCGALLTQRPGLLNAVLVVVSGNQSLRLEHFGAVFAAVTNATRTFHNGINTPPKVLLGAVVNAAISHGLRVTVLAGYEQRTDEILR